MFVDVDTERWEKQKHQLKTVWASVNVAEILQLSENFDRNVN